MRSAIVKHKKWLAIGLIVSLAAAGGFSLWQGKKGQTAALPQTVKVERGDVSMVVSSTGTISPLNSVDISSKITGQLKEVRVKENDPVKAGQVLVVLKDTDLQADATQARERLNNAAATYERKRRLNGIGAVSDQELDDALMTYHTAQASYDGVVSKLDETVITSPIDGVVIGEPLPAGQMVAQGISNPMVILTVADMSKMQIKTQVDETDIGKVAVGQSATFTVSAHPDKVFTGVVSGVSQKATTTQNVVYYAVTIDVHDEQNLLKPAMTARVNINASEAKNVLTIPLSAVRSDSSGQYVNVLKNNGQQDKVVITTGVSGDEKVEVTSGLAEGDKVVVSQSKQQTQSPSGQRNGAAGGNPLNMMRRM